MRYIKKTICFLMVFTFVLCCFGQEVVNSMPYMVNDTLFIKKDSVQSIFIDKTKNSKYYSISNITFAEIENNEIYKQNFEFLKTQKIKLKNHKIDNKLPQKWTPLYLYNGEYYIYYPNYPCDYWAYRLCFITDSTFVDAWATDVMVDAILEYKKIKNNIFQFNVAYLSTFQNRKITFYLIDKKRGIAILRDENGEGSGDFLMVDADKAKNFPVIVNECDNGKMFQLDFQKPNFEELINKQK